MKYAIVIVIGFLFSFSALAQQRIPNLGDKACGLWIGLSDKAKTSPSWAEQVEQMEWWAQGYLKGVASQYKGIGPNPLVKLNEDIGLSESLEWMRAYCRVNKHLSISDAATALFEELKTRR